MEWNDAILDLKNVGEQRAKKLNRLGIQTIGDLLEHYPRDYKDRSRMVTIADLSETEENTFVARVRGEGQSVRRGRLVMTKVQAYDETGEITLVWYNQPYMKTAFQPNESYLFTGKMQKKYGRMEIASPEYEIVGKSFAGGRIVPVYPLSEGLSQKILRGFLAEALHCVQGTLPEILPLWLRKKYHLAERNFAIQNIHFPVTETAFYDARRRLVFEELFLLQTALSCLRQEWLQQGAGILMQHQDALQKIQESFPFPLTNAQKKVLQEIQNDMTSGKMMNRLVQGDVGSGKTAVAMAAAYWVIQNGYQVVMMAPTEVLAEQHAQSFQKMFAPLGIRVVSLFGSMKAKEKRAALAEIADGSAKMIVGTHAVIQTGVTYQKLGLVITDEQHRFGVRQRGMLAEKGENPHVLVMTATPIPRTLALILYGDLDISIIDELPPGRQKIDTLAVNSTYRPRIYTFLEKQAQSGRQSYVICPMIEENEKLEVENVLDYTEKLQKTIPNCRIACVHGKMKAVQKQEIMETFAAGETDILISTTVIEVGINVPNATVMLVENAERFGLAQLHQLRGRVGRGDEKSYCILVSDAKTKIAQQRMQTMTKTTDGFVISEMDLQLRGPGEFFGTKQHGLPELKIANLYRDMQLLKEAQDAASTLLAKDPALQEPEHGGLRAQISTWFEGKNLEL